MFSYFKSYKIATSYLESDYFSTLPSFERKDYIGENTLKKIKKVMTSFVLDFIHILKPKTQLQKSISHRPWIIVDSSNNYQAVESISSHHLADAEIVTFSRYNKFPINDITRLHLGYSLIHVLKTIIFVFRYWTVLSDRWDLYFRYIGVVESSEKLLIKFSPTSILFTNDHLPHNKALMMSANKLNIKTGYIQHACAREDFGPLLVDIAFHEGMDSVVKYSNAGTDFNNLQYHLIGMPKFDVYAGNRKEPRKINIIGIAFNTSDQIENIYQLMNLLAEKGFSVIIRPHPKDHRDFNIFQKNEISDAKSETSFDFILKVDAVIAGNSSIHLEATMLNIPSYYMQLRDEPGLFDMYGFYKNNLIVYCKNLSSLIDEINLWNKSPDNIYQKAIYYNSTIGTPHEDSATLLATKLISKHLTFKLKELKCAASQAS